MVHTSFLRRFAILAVAAFACILIAGCAEEGNTVVSGELTAEQQAEADNVVMPGSPGEGGTAPATPE